MPVEVDILLVGFDGDGGYGYKVDKQALEELLGSATADNTVCPTVWETGEHAAVCFSINYVVMDSSKLNKPLSRIEAALESNMEWVGDRSQDWPDGSKEVQVYEVDASGELEATVWDILDEAYIGRQQLVNRDMHNQIVIVNPSKLRMAPKLPPPPHLEGSARDAHAPHHPNADMDFVAEWKRGVIGSAHVVEQEAGFLYRYRYAGRGSSSAFVSQYNFLVIDVGAGPVSYGPLASPSGAVAPTAMPRLMPMFLRMTRELEKNTQVGTYREHMLEEAARGQSAVFVGQLGSAVAAASKHMFAADLMMAGAEALAGRRGHQSREEFDDGRPKRVAVPIVIFQDHMRELEYEGDGRQWIDTDMVQLALDELLPADVAGVVSVSRHMLHHHRQLAAALVKARHSRSDAVLAEPPDTGLHRSQTVSLDSQVLLRELRLLLASPGGDDLVGSLTDHLSEDYVHQLPYMEDAQEFVEQKRQETKMLPVFVFSLERSPDQMMFENRQLVAAGRDAVVVLQLLGNPALDDYSRGRVYSGHMTEGHHLLVDAGEAPTRAVIAGLATALGGVVPSHQRYCTAEHAVVEDWRWSVGAVPWGPYSNHTAISSILASTAKRNMMVARIEKPLRRLIAAMDSIDGFIMTHLQGPFAFLRKSFYADTHLGPDAAAPTATFAQIMPYHHLLDDLARQHQRYAPPPPTVRSILGGGHKPKARGTSPSSRDGEGAPPGEPPGEDDDEEEHSFNAAAAAAAAAADMVQDQHVLSPNVAERLQTKLDAIGELLEKLGYDMYSRNWVEVDSWITQVADKVDEFVADVEQDLEHGAEVVSCCNLVHGPRGAVQWFVISLIVVLMGGFAIVVAVVIRSQRLYTGGRGGGGASISRQLSKGLSGRSLSGSLPSWSEPSPRAPVLPR
ncbi:hypothetical protein HYH03_010044 [Edaphochlamys debaryana]|uniref:DUF7906 domain-containing protein n=1 Tax=Edaphochlamys debaryana TaxID=47281 RepID=A0A835Y338_9CHLO|nr:hypothetical protein HYH03_010044 [Edaphochlamys debaryana]|eukprot:KAG2491675.1 hypothetical protein HYH03_010044 [Edaphochlamys debaryana]